MQLICPENRHKRRITTRSTLVAGGGAPRWFQTPASRIARETLKKKKEEFRTDRLSFPPGHLVAQERVGIRLHKVGWLQRRQNTATSNTQGLIDFHVLLSPPRRGAVVVQFNLPGKYRQETINNSQYSRSPWRSTALVSDPS